MEVLTVQVLAVLLVATVIRSAFGFGEALIAVPLLALVIPIETAAPIAALVSMTVAAVILLQDWAEVHSRVTGRLVLSTLAGVPLGLLLLTRAPAPLVKGALAILIIAFSAYFLVSVRKPELPDDRLAWAFGLAAGVLGGAYGMNGPPLVVYGSLRRWSPAGFRATLQGYFLPASAAVMGGYWIAGLWTPTVTRFYVVSLPVVAVAILIGQALNRRMHAGRFLALVHVGLVLVGIALLVQAVRPPS